MLAPGDRIGPLSIERPLGRGGMGEVYLALDERLERLVAIKLLPATSGMDPDAHARMLREARSLSSLKHGSIVTIYDIGLHDGRSYIVMEYVDGETFDELVKRRGRLPPEEAVAILAQVCDAVAAAHDAGVLHRDIKSANLMIESGGTVKVLDFGLSKRTEPAIATPASIRRSAPKLTGAPTHPERSGDSTSRDEVANAPTVAPASEVANAPTVVPTSQPATSQPATSQPATDATTPAPSSGSTGAGSARSAGSAGSFSHEPHTVHGAAMGTPGWAPPELIEGRPADARTDVFSLGCVLYHLLTGNPPFPGASWATQRELIEAGATPPSRTAGVPPAFDALIAAALDPDPERRPADVRSLVAAARAAIARRRPWPAIAASAAGLVAAGGAIAWVATRDDGTAAPAAPPPAAPPTQLTTLDGCAYSPMFLDEDTVVFDLTRDGNVDLYQLDLGKDGTSAAPPRRLTSDPGWEWRSAPGLTASEVVFPVSDQEVTAIDVLDIATGARRRLADETGAGVAAGGAYYYAPQGGREIRRVRDGNDETLLGLPPTRPIDTMVASPDGRRLAVTLFDEHTLPALCTVELASPALACIDVEMSSARPAFAASGDVLYFGALAGTGIRRVPVAGGASVEAVPGVSSSGGIAVSPRGSALAYSDCTSRTQLFRVLEDPKRPFTADEFAGGPTYGPDGVLAFVRGMRRDPAIVVRTPDGSTREHVARMDAVISDLAIAPDGDAIAFVIAEGDTSGIYITHRQSASVPPNRITEGGKDSRPVFAGDDVLFTRREADGTPRLMRVARDGSAAAVASARPRVTLGAGGGRALLGSPDRRFYYWWDPATSTESPGPGVPDSGPPAHVAVSPDGRWVVFIGGTGGQEVWRGSGEPGAKPALVYTIPGDRNALTATIDDDGQPLVAVGSWAGELFLVRAHPGHPW